MWVRFIADVDAAGKVVGELRELTWFTPVRTTQEGLFPIQQREEAGEPIVDWGRPLRGEIVAGRYQVIGSVRSVRGGMMQVIYKEGDAERQLLVQLAPDVNVTIDITNKSVAGALLKPGDAVVVRGRQRENQVQALSIVARREEPYGKPLAVRPPRRTEPVAQAGDDEPMPVASNDDEPLPVGGSLGPVAEDDVPADGAAETQPRAHSESELARSALRLANAPQLAKRADKNVAVGNRQRRVRFSVAQRIGGQQFVLRLGGEH